MSVPPKWCPFCGAEATRDYCTIRNARGFDIAIQRSCVSCGATGPRVNYKPPPLPNPEVDEAWNRRVTDKAALVEVARRAILLDDVEEDFRTMTAESLVDEYLAEQERTDAAD